MAPHAVKRAGETGFTMIEVMIALVLTALAIMGIIALYITETKASGFSRHTTEAAVLAQDKIEKLRTQGTAVAIPLTNEPPVGSTLNERGTTVPPGIYQRQYTEVLTTADYADITVTVNWSDDGLAHTITMKARRNR
jgi:Tfp pilus assembly protein PilV